MPAPTPPSEIDDLPTAPSRADPTNFSARADALLSALGPMVTQINLVLAYIASAVTYVAGLLTDAADDIAALVTAALSDITSARNTAVDDVEDAATAGVAAVAAVVAAAGFAGTSTTSMAVGTGTKNLTLQPNLAFKPGSYVEIADTAAPVTNYMIGTVTSYNVSTGAMVANITHIGGSGTKTAWIVTLTGKPGSDANVTAGNIAAALGDEPVLETLAITTVAGTTYTLLNSDNAKVIRCTSASPVTITVPASLFAGFNCAILQAGAGLVTISAGAGATAHNVDADTASAGQYAMLGIFVETNVGGSAAVYDLIGRTA